jgi:hypothetical protein
MTAPGQVLDPARILVASRWNFGAQLARTDQQGGAVLSIDPNAQREHLFLDPFFARAGGQAASCNGAVMLFSAQSPPFLNSVSAPGAATAEWTAAANPLGISINNAFGRVWFANAPNGLRGPGSNTIADPNGQPLAHAPDAVAGGVFADTLTNRQPQQVTPGNLSTGAVANALLGKSPDGSGRAVFAVVNADGSLVQVHAQLGVDGLAPAGTIGALHDPAAPTPFGADDVPRAGILWSWSSDTLLVSDPCNDAIVALTIPDVDGQPVKQVTADTRLGVPAGVLNVPVDLAPVTPETHHEEYASNSSLAQGSDFYVANYGDNSIARLRADGSVVDQRTVVIGPDLPINPWHLNGIAVAPDGSRLWACVSGPVVLLPCPQGAVLELPVF